MKPPDAVPTPESPLIEAVRLEDIEAHVDIEIERQLPDGTWELGWSWGEDYPEAWKEAEREWKGYVTLGKLKPFRAYNRL